MPLQRARPAIATLSILTASLLVAGCSTLGASGPRTGNVEKANGASFANSRIQLVELTDAVARRVIASRRQESFAEALGDSAPPVGLIGRGDTLDITIWEAPPAVLFGASGSDVRLPNGMPGIANATARPTQLPEVAVNRDGRISLPFVGEIQAAGRSPDVLSREIVARLRGIAHQPQAMVRVARNATASVTVVGEVTSSAHVPLSGRGERLLDVLASVGGVRQPIGKTTIQVTRGGMVVSQPLDVVIRDPRQNVRLAPDDIVTAVFQPYSFTALGASGANAEVNFEGNGITLAQALGRIGGLREDRANIHGVFIFRLEDPAALDPATVATAATTPDGKIPVIYRLDLADPSAFFVAQGFPIRNRDVVYVSTAPLVDFQKFVGLVSSLAITGLSITSTVP